MCSVSKVSVWAPGLSTHPRMVRAVALVPGRCPGGHSHSRAATPWSGLSGTSQDTHAPHERRPESRLLSPA